MTQDDQRPDLDAALDAVIPSLTAVDDDTAATSLRRTRIALAERAAGSDTRGWRWTMPAAAAIAAIVAAVVFWPRTHVTETPRVAVNRAATAPAVLPAARPPVAPVASAPAPVTPTRVARTPHVAAASAPRPDEPSRPDPLIVLVRAVEAIPDDAWARGTTASSAVLVQAVPLDPIAIAPLETPAITDPPPAEPIAPGEP